MMEEVKVKKVEVVQIVVVFEKEIKSFEKERDLCLKEVEKVLKEVRNVVIKV